MGIGGGVRGIVPSGSGVGASAGVGIGGRAEASCRPEAASDREKAQAVAAAWAGRFAASGVGSFWESASVQEHSSKPEIDCLSGRARTRQPQRHQ